MEESFKPILRYVDVIPSNHQGKPVFLLRDPLAFINEIVVVPQYMGFLLALMDGKHDLRDLQAEATKRLGQVVPIEDIKKLVEFLDEKGLLWSERFEEIKKRAYEKWLKVKVRPMAHAMQAYPVSPAEAKFFVEDILKLAEGVVQEKTPRVLIAPHIDLRVGARGFAESYARFKPEKGARIILLGVGHHLDFPISVLTKDFATPFGVVKNDKGGLFFLTQSRKLNLFPDHMAHRMEHSLEFQMLFLHYLLEEEFVVLPFLVGPFLLFKEHKKLVEDFAQAIVELFDERTYLVLGIDFCHLGLRYGDPFAVTEKERKEALELDKELMESAFEGASERIEELAPKAEKMKVCGFSCLYLLSLIMKKLGKKCKGEIYYQDALPFGQGSVVSVASAGIYF